MDQRNRRDIYRDFLEFVRKDLDGQRKTVSRRMLNVFVWCFLVPAGVAVLLLLLVRVGLLPRTLLRYMDWIVLVFPILYSLYILSSEVLSGMVSVIRRGGAAATLGQAETAFVWREKTVESMRAAVRVSAEQWSWIGKNFALDLKQMRSRTGHLTALAGAIFFLLMQGIDALDEHAPVAEPAYLTVQGFFEASSNNISQFIALGLFLVLFYLSGSQTHHSLERYLDCTELLSGDGK